ncbi:matrix-remodeling-associated protein 5 [Fukomys damarensis]|uniref:matrix-remodeling-associated protein 5 n=1 Tax=Fukomys damarensis TaxID=885580 RepID=UPI001454F662|nr:matrix-remodeling-associated protein 5 [Fukomys damarensis]
MDLPHANLVLAGLGTLSRSALAVAYPRDNSFPPPFFFRFNSIQAISETSFAGLSKLELLMIHSNNIPSLPDGALGDLSSLQVFKFSYNKLRVITRQTFQGLPGLMRLHLDHNQIEFIHPQGFQGLLSLRLLHLEGNLLHQLHPGTFSTFTFLDHFQLSTLRHLYLAENRLQRLPDGVLQSLPLLENLYLHGNPWACDCEMGWFLDWTLRSKGILKCKKDKAYDGGQWCPTCSSPREFRKREILKLPDVPCVRPSIQSALRQNHSRAREDEEEEEEEEEEQEEERPWDGPLRPEDTAPASRWNISFNLTDEHGNAVLLRCAIRKPAGLPGLHLNQTEPAQIDINPTVHVQLDRRRSSAQKVLLSYSARYSQTISAEDRAQSRSWVLIESGGAAHRAHTFLEGAPGQLSCRVRASESPSISWVLPDGSVLRAPSREPEGRFSVLSGGWLKIGTVQRSDAGLYRCVAAVRDEVDQMAFRVFVQVPTIQFPEGSVVTIEKDAGEPVTLPCSPSAVPEAHLSWILPDKKIVDASANASHTYVLADGSLSIPNFAEDEGGSGVGGEGGPPGRTRHPKDQGILIQAEREASAGATAPKKGRRKLRLSKPTEEKDPESNVAEGRRVFESRRRVNVANKQINPERWADILARVRGKNLPKATGVPQDVVTATLPSESPEGTSLSPGGFPPSEPPTREALDPEESSAQASLSGEEEQDSGTLSSPGMGQEHGHSSVLPEPWVTSPSLEDTGTGRDFAGMTEAVAPNEMVLQWQLAPTPGSEAYETPTARNSEGPSGGQTATEAGSLPADLEPIAQPSRREEEPPLDVASLAKSQTVNSFHPELETHPPPGAGEETLEDTPPTSPASSQVPSAPPESLKGDSSAERDVTARSPVPEKTDSAWPGKKTWATERAPFGTKVMEKKFWGESSPSGRPQREEQDSTSSGALEAVSTTSPSAWPWTVPRGPLPDRGVTTGATKTPSPSAPPLPSTQPSRRRPSGRRRLRPHKSRQRQKPSPPTPFSSVASSTPAPTSPLSQTQTSKAASGSAVASAWVDERLNTDKAPESASRRRGGKRPHPRRPSTPAPLGSRRPVSKASSSPETGPSGPETLLPLWESTGPDVPTRPDGSVTAAPETAATPRRVQGTTPVTARPAADGEAVAGDRDGARGDSGGKDGELLAGTESSTPAPWVSTLGEPEAGSPGSTSWHLPSTAPPGTGLGEHFPDPALFGEPEGPDAASHSAPAAPLSTSVPWGEIGVLTTFSSATVEQSAAQAETTPSGWVTRESTVGRVPSETRPQDPLPTPAQVEEPAASLSPRAPASLDPTALMPTPPAGAAPRQDLLSNSVGNPGTKAPLESTEGPQHEGRPKELATPPPKPDGPEASAKREWAERGLDGRTMNSPPRGPGSHRPREQVHTARPPAPDPTRPTPPRGTPRPPLGATESSVRYFTTSQPPRRATGQPEIPAYPSRLLPDGEPATTPPLPSTMPGVPLQPFKPSISSGFPSQRTTQFNGYPRISGHNDIPKPRIPAHELPKPSLSPYHAGGRLSVFINRIFSVPRLGVTLTPQTSTSPAPVTRETKVTPGPYRRFPSQNFLHMDLGPPAPPGLQPPRTTSPPWPRFQKVPPVSTTQSPTFPVTAAGQSPGSPHHSAPRVSAGGPPVPGFWTLGEKPQIVTKSPQTASVTAETDATFPCEATGKPKPFITWTKVSTGALLTPNTRVQRFEVLQNGTLLIRRVQVQDRGQYLCTASNLHGVDKMGVLLSVEVQQPEILASRFQDVTVYLGDTIAMDCLAQGSPVPQISWIFPDRRVWQTASPVAGRVTLHRNRTLSIRDASFADRGVYKCVYGGTLRLHCGASGDPWPRILWRLPSKRMIDALFSFDSRVRAFGNGTLVVRSVTEKDAGHYLCVARNEVGDDHATLQVHVVMKPAKIEHSGDEAHKVVRGGGDLKVDCVATGLPSPEISWGLPDGSRVNALMQSDDGALPEGVVLPAPYHGHRVTVHSNGSLDIRSLRKSDSMRLVCMARSEGGEARMVVQLTVLEPAQKPVFHDPVSEKITATAGHTIMREASVLDRGTYTCRVQQEPGPSAALSVPVIVVAYPPRITSEPTPVIYARPGSTVRLSCLAVGVPKAEVSWELPDKSHLKAGAQPRLYGNRFLHPQGALTIQQATQRDAGFYKCTAKNILGTDSKTTYIHIY